MATTQRFQVHMVREESSCNYPVAIGLLPIGKPPYRLELEGLRPGAVVEITVVEPAG